MMKHPLPPQQRRWLDTDRLDEILESISRELETGQLSSDERLLANLACR